MSEFKHTPGPWQVAPDPGEVCQECGNEVFANALVGWKTRNGDFVGLATIIADDREESNARLIAASPELLELVQAYLESAPAFRAAQVGEPNSDARKQQQKHIETEDKARALLARIAGTTGG